MSFFEQKLGQVEQVAKAPGVGVVLKKYTWILKLIRLALKYPEMSVLVALGSLSFSVGLPLLLFVFILGTQQANANQSIGAESLPTAVTPGVIPTAVLPDLEAAANKYHVPLQLLAGEAETESGFNPDAKNYAPGTHAGGMFQFEPGTWSGSADPFAGPALFDTDPKRISKYGGYGVDADHNGTASPFDPADAAMAAAHYLSNLYKDYKHSWSLACYWYGSETQAYVSTVFSYMASFVDQEPVDKVNSVDWFFGGKNGQSFSNQTPTSFTISASDWDPIYAPEDGHVTVQYTSSGDVIHWTDGADITWLTLKGGVVAFIDTDTDVKAGTLLGFVTTKSVTVEGNSDPLSLYGGNVPKWVTGS